MTSMEKFEAFATIVKYTNNKNLLANPSSGGIPAKDKKYKIINVDIECI